MDDLGSGGQNDIHISQYTNLPIYSSPQFNTISTSDSDENFLSRTPDDTSISHSPQGSELQSSQADYPHTETLLTQITNLPVYNPPKKPEISSESTSSARVLNRSISDAIQDAIDYFEQNLSEQAPHLNQITNLPVYSLPIEEEYGEENLSAVASVEDMTKSTYITNLPVYSSPATNENNTAPVNDDEKPPSIDFSQSSSEDSELKLPDVPCDLITDISNRQSELQTETENKNEETDINDHTKDEPVLLEQFTNLPIYYAANDPATTEISAVLNKDKTTEDIAVVLSEHVVPSAYPDLSQYDSEVSHEDPPKEKIAVKLIRRRTRDSFSKDPIHMLNEQDQQGNETNSPIKDCRDDQTFEETSNNFSPVISDNDKSDSLKIVKCTDPYLVFNETQSPMILPVSPNVCQDDDKDEKIILVDTDQIKDETEASREMNNTEEGISKSGSECKTKEKHNDVNTSKDIVTAQHYKLLQGNRRRISGISGDRPLLPSKQQDMTKKFQHTSLKNISEDATELQESAEWNRDIQQITREKPRRQPTSKEESLNRRKLTYDLGSTNLGSLNKENEHKEISSKSKKNRRNSNAIERISEMCEVYDRSMTLKRRNTDISDSTLNTGRNRKQSSEKLDDENKSKMHRNKKSMKDSESSPNETNREETSCTQPRKESMANSSTRHASVISLGGLFDDPDSEEKELQSSLETQKTENSRKISLGEYKRWIGQYEENNKEQSEDDTVELEGQRFRRMSDIELDRWNQRHPSIISLGDFPESEEGKQQDDEPSIQQDICSHGNIINDVIKEEEEPEETEDSVCYSGTEIKDEWSMRHSSVISIDGLFYVAENRSDQEKQCKDKFKEKGVSKASRKKIKTTVEYDIDHTNMVPKETNTRKKRNSSVISIDGIFYMIDETVDASSNGTDKNVAKQVPDAKDTEQFPTKDTSENVTSRKMSKTEYDKWNKRHPSVVSIGGMFDSTNNDVQDPEQVSVNKVETDLRLGRNQSVVSIDGELYIADIPKPRTFNTRHPSIISVDSSFYTDENIDKMLEDFEDDSTKSDSEPETNVVKTKHIKEDKISDKKADKMIQKTNQTTDKMERVNDNTNTTKSKSSVLKQQPDVAFDRWNKRHPSVISLGGMFDDQESQPKVIPLRKMSKTEYNIWSKRHPSVISIDGMFEEDDDDDTTKYVETTKKKLSEEDIGNYSKRHPSVTSLGGMFDEEESQPKAISFRKMSKTEYKMWSKRHPSVISIDGMFKEDDDTTKSSETTKKISSQENDNGNYSKRHPSVISLGGMFNEEESQPKVIPLRKMSKTEYNMWSKRHPSVISIDGMFEEDEDPVNDSDKTEKESRETDWSRRHPSVISIDGMFYVDESFKVDDTTNQNEIESNVRRKTSQKTETDTYKTASSAIKVFGANPELYKRRRSRPSIQAQLHRSPTTAEVIEEERASEIQSLTSERRFSIASSKSSQSASPRRKTSSQAIETGRPNVAKDGQRTKKNSKSKIKSKTKHNNEAKILSQDDDEERTRIPMSIASKNLRRCSTGPEEQPSKERFLIKENIKKSTTDSPNVENEKSDYRRRFSYTVDVSLKKDQSYPKPHSRRSSCVNSSDSHQQISNGDLDSDFEETEEKYSRKRLASSKNEKLELSQNSIEEEENDTESSDLQVESDFEDARPSSAPRSPQGLPEPPPETQPVQTSPEKKTPSPVQIKTQKQMDTEDRFNKTKKMVSQGVQVNRRTIATSADDIPLYRSTRRQSSPFSGKPKKFIRHDTSPEIRFTSWQPLEKRSSSACLRAAQQRQETPGLPPRECYVNDTPDNAQSTEFQDPDQISMSHDDYINDTTDLPDDSYVQLPGSIPYEELDVHVPTIEDEFILTPDDELMEMYLKRQIKDTSTAYFKPEPITKEYVDQVLNQHKKESKRHEKLSASQRPWQDPSTYSPSRGTSTRRRARTAGPLPSARLYPGIKKDKVGQDTERERRTKSGIVRSSQSPRRTYSEMRRPQTENAELVSQEIRKLKNSMDQMRDKLFKQKPKEKGHIPFIYNDLEPYSDTKLVEMLYTHMQKRRYTSRLTATTLIDPWKAHKMDLTILPGLNKMTLKSRPQSGPAFAARNKSAVSGKQPMRPDTAIGEARYPNLSVGSRRIRNRVLTFSQMPQLKTLQVHVRL